MTIPTAPIRGRLYRLATAILMCLCALPLFTGCVKHSLTNQALSFNKTVHDHRVEQLLINVLRASNREPMALTAVTSLSTNNNKRLNVGPVSGTFGALKTEVYNGVLSGGVSASPNMALTILDDDPDFMKGFVKPVPDTTIRYFVEQGWNTKLLSYLLIEEIKDSRIGDIRNDPRDPEMFAKFDRVLDENLHHLVLVEEQRRKEPKRQTTTAVKISEDEHRTEVVTVEATDAVVQHGGLHIQGSDAVLMMRSPQSVLYYLGELARIQLDPDSDGVIPEIKSGGRCEPLFLVEKVRKTGPGDHMVSYRGCQYRIPDRPTNRSLQALSFVQQLINLQTKTIAPAPSTLRLVAQ